ncbi:hypothetical protein [Chitinophaga pinensis]|uniref:hypothetical protein n=1 Tax=Chitinophaga pinensis TaxID=79329 RepID=UPI00019E3F42|nr:hypothetical protein [Chitinophaga pinensis]
MDLGKTAAEKKYGAQALSYPDKVIAANPDHKAGKMKKEQLKGDPEEIITHLSITC